GVREVYLAGVECCPIQLGIVLGTSVCLHAGLSSGLLSFSSRRRHTRSVSAFLLNRSSDLGSDKTLQVGYANHFYRSAHKFEQICRHRLRRQNVGYSNFSQPQSHLSFCVLLQYLVERRRVVTQLGKLD